MSRIVAVIPARGGSKSIPLKNIRQLNGKPLLAHTIEAALQCPLIDMIVVSTDDPQIADVAQAYGIQVPALRPKELAQDHTLDFPVLVHVTEQYALNPNDIIVHLRPTSPHRDPELIEQCIKCFVSDKHATSLKTVSTPPHSPFKMFLDTPYLISLFPSMKEPYNQPRQLLPPAVEPNGCVDIYRVSTLLDYQDISGPRIRQFKMDAEATDIDTEDDFARVQTNMKSSVRLGDTLVGKDHPCFIIAEAGINHNGCLNKAKKLIDIAVSSGAQCVKFQKRDVNSLFTERAKHRVYNSTNSFGNTYGEHKHFLEFNEQQFTELKQYADSKNILFTASPWDIKSVDLLERIGVPFYKVASADLTNTPLLEYILRKNKPVILSTGMATMNTVSLVVSKALLINPRIILLQCTSTYPAEENATNLRVMDTYRTAFPSVVIGYSGHERGIAISLAAATMGASLIERHITEDRTQKGGDHSASLEPSGFVKLIRDIRNMESALGDGVKRIMPGEEDVYKKLAKSVCTINPIPKGTTITPDMVCCKSDTIQGISPLAWSQIIEAVAKQDIDADVALQLSDLTT